MWRLAVKQEKPIGNIMTEQEIAFEDENQNNLLDLVRYLVECKASRKTWFEIKEIDNNKEVKE